MDFNYFYHRHQVSLFMSDNAASAESRAVHRELTRDYAAKIAAALRKRRLAVAA
jgi:hypothetical protein